METKIYKWEEMQGIMSQILLSHKEIAERFTETDKKFVETDKKFVETQKEMAESDKKLKKEMAESDKKFKKEMAESDKKLKERIKELSVQIGGIGNSNGDFAEEFFYTGFSATMQINNIKYDYIERNRNKKIKELKGEYDILLVNTNKILIIEVKYKLTNNQVISFYEKKLPKFKKLFPEFKDYTVHGAMASFSLDKRAKNTANKNGILLFTQANDKIKNITPKDIVLQEF